ncbi:hypothetical protein DFJ74DRAFT_443633 [Hyaloraphidium curvatum]|nr:hypothetical protein DFJ74DRAFT_443633 [Hyaloraphidium curvatum]
MEPAPPPPPLPASLSAAEWAAVFPSPPVEVSVFAHGPPPDPAAAERASNPLTRYALLREAAASPLLLGISDLNFKLQPWGRRIPLRSALSYAAQFAVLGTTWALRGDRFGTPQMAAATASNVLEFLGAAVVPLVAFRNSAAFPAMDNLDTHALAGFTRWSQLVRASADRGIAAGDDKDGEDGSEATLTQSRHRWGLLTHRDGDKLCPCPKPECMGKVGQAYANLRLVQIILALSVMCGYGFFRMYTPLVGLADVFWTNAGFIVLGVFALLALVDEHFPTILGLVQWTNVRLIELSRRLQRRAMLLALDSFLARFRYAIEHGEDPKLELDGDELYVHLHECLLGTWLQRAPLLAGLVGGLFGLALVEVIVIIINAFAGSCIPLYTVLTLCYVLFLLLTHLVDESVGNSQISDVRNLYHDARREIRALAVRGESGPRSPSTIGVLARLRSHDALLASFLEVERCRTRLAGFVIDYTFARNFVVTLVTVAFGLWTILRYAGLHMTAESVCPYY